MRWKIYAALLVGATVATAATCIAMTEAWAICIGVAVQLILLFFLLRSVNKPLSAVRNGIYLLREQDFSTRLCATGQADADKIVSLFNGMMDSMKEERLKNLEQDNFLEQLMTSSPMGIAICDFNRNIIKSNPAFKKYGNPQVMAVLMKLDEGECLIARPEPSLVLRCSRLWFMDSGFKRPYFLVELLTHEVIEAETNVYNKIVRTLGHEVNNTLGSVVSVLESMASLNSDDDEVVNAVESSRKRCLNLVSFVKEYADIVKLPEPNAVDVDLNEWIGDMRPFLQSMLPDNIVLEVEACAAKRTVVKADSSLLDRVLVNVVKNAIESIRDMAGVIRISVIKGGFMVEDNGAGISKAVAQRIFTPFFSTKRADRGLGLMLVAEVLRRHNASFSLFTDEADGLTKFIVKFA